MEDNNSNVLSILSAKKLLSSVSLFVEDEHVDNVDMKLHNMFTEEQIKYIVRGELLPFINNTGEIK